METNRLAREKSPYLLQHAHNPVDWFPWGEEAFERARQEEKPIFLSIGYSTCHWCHVMERESFADERLAANLNANFISIKVDREERPDVDKIYMTFVQSTTGGGGWPLNVFLTPELKPFYGGTYIPPETRQGRPGFKLLLEQINQLWRERKSEIVTSSEELCSRLEKIAADGLKKTAQPTRETLQNALEVFREAYDPAGGGFGAAPKFPQPAIPIFVLRAGKRFADAEAVKMVLQTCDKMAAGGIHDQLGGGFARYSVDTAWLVPHFEKMLYDNAQLAQLYLDAYLAGGQARHASLVRDILDYVLRDMTHPAGGFSSAEDADSEGHEGKFYCWTRQELSELLTAGEFNVATKYFGITAEGNFYDHSHPAPLAGQNVLSVANPDISPAAAPLLAAAKQKMLHARTHRARPLRDDKILASWNGLMLGAFARAGVALGEEKYLAAAQRNLEFLKLNLWDKPSGSLSHRWRDGQRNEVQLLESYAFLLDGVIHLYEATLQPEHLVFAIELAVAVRDRFFDPDNGGFWQSGGGTRGLIMRMKDDYDGAEPSGNSVATLSLLKLAALTGRDDFKQAAETTLLLYAQRLKMQPASLAVMLQAVDFWLEEPRRAVICGNAESASFKKLLRAAHLAYQPNKVILGNSGAVEPFARTLTANGEPAAFICTGAACQIRTTDPAELREILG